jgi:hypothetical protein
LSLDVFSDNLAAECDGHFGLGANGWPSVVAPVVVGKPKLSLSEQESALIKRIQDVAEDLERNSARGVLLERVKELAATASDLTKLLRPT